MRRVIITETVAKLYLHPLAWSEVSDEIFSGTEADVLDELGNDWLKILTEYGYSGFLQESSIRNVSSEDNGKRWIISASFADVLIKPVIRSNILETLSKGSFVTHCEYEDDDGYVKIRTASGSEGYVREKHVCTYEKTTEFIDSSTLRTSLVNTAMEYMGVQYRWGGKTHAGIDCSGLCFMSYFLNGIVIYRDAKLMDGFPVKKIPFESIGKGDLLYFPGHIAMYVGDGNYIHSSLGESGVAISSFRENRHNYRNDLAQHFLFAGSIF